MKKALSYKIILLFIAFALSFALAFSFFGVKTALAADITSPNAYFSGGERVEFKDDNLVATVKTGSNVSITNALVVDDLKITLDVPETVNSFKVTLTYDSYFVNGAYNTDTDEFDKTIENEFTLTDRGSDVAIVITTDDNVLTVNGQTKTKEVDGTDVTDIYYNIKGADKCSAKIKFSFTLADGTESVDIVFKSIDQKQSDGTGDYKQTFELEDGKIKTLAKPRVAINSLPMKKTGVNALKAVYGKDYTLSFTAYSVFGSVGSVYIDKTSIDADVVWLDPTSEMPKNIEFENTAAVSFKVKTSDIDSIEEYTVTSVKLDDDNDAPTYIDYTANKDVYAQYNELVKKAAEKEYTDTEGNKSTHSIRLGDTYTVPSLQDLVEDDLNVFSDLTYTVYYKTPSNASGSTSSLSFTVSEAGRYEFYVVFKDKAGNEIDKDDFYTVDDEDNNKIKDISDIVAAIEDPSTVVGLYKYFPAVFRFTINDDAPISVEAPASQGKGYIDTQYTASEFKIQSSGNSVKYTLYYNPDNDATDSSEGWVALPILADITEDYNENGFTYSDIEKLGYDGKYTFTPVKIGRYKIECDVTSDNQVRSATASTLISVADRPTVVKVPSHWLRDNVWSVVFLLIGTLSLIGIIVLLFIKPKEEIETDETGDALNVSAKE